MHWFLRGDEQDAPRPHLGFVLSFGAVTVGGDSERHDTTEE